jgi:hypothetical protein
MKTLKLDGHSATLEKISIRAANLKKGPRQLVADLQLTTRTDAKNCAFLPKILFDKNGAPRLGCEDEILCAGEIEHHDFTLSIAPKKAVRYYDVSARRFSATLLPQRRVALSFAVALKVTERKIGELAGRLGLPIIFSLEPQAHLFDKKGIRRSKAEADKAAKAAAKKTKGGRK